MFAVVEDRVGGDDLLPVVVGGFAAVRVHIEAGEVAAGDVDADAVAFFENVAARVELDFEFVGLAGCHEGLFLVGFAIAGANDAVAHDEVESIGELFGGGIDVEKFGGEVGIDGGRGGPQFDGDGAYDGGVFLEGRGGED